MPAPQIKAPMRDDRRDARIAKRARRSDAELDHDRRVRERARAAPDPYESALNAAARGALNSSNESALDAVRARVEGDGAIPGPWTIAGAAARGHLEMIEYLRTLEPPCEWDEKACTEAAENARAETLKYLVTNGCPSGAMTCAFTARKGDLDLLAWLRERGVPWDEQTTSGAAYNGHLHVLIWAREHGCKWNWRTTYEAAYHGYLGCLKYALDRDCPLPTGDDLNKLIETVRRRAAEDDDEDEPNEFAQVLKLVDPTDPLMNDLQNIMSFIDSYAVELAPEGEYLDVCSRAQRIFTKLSEMKSGKFERRDQRVLNVRRDFLNEVLQVRRDVVNEFRL